MTGPDGLSVRLCYSGHDNPLVRLETRIGSAVSDKCARGSERRLRTLTKDTKKKSRKVEGMRAGGVSFLLYAFGTLLLLVHMSSSAAFSEQTREECNDCCSRSGYDEYYEEQCKLKCFRNHDHCTGKGARQKTPAAEAKEPEQARTEAREPSEPAAPRERDIRLAWPNPLNLVAGKEGEAAAQILAVNGVSPQHPFYQAALQDIQTILIDFVRRNPQGGKLPTTQLKRILRQLK